MAGTDREIQKQRERERELSSKHLKVCAAIIPPLQILLDDSSRDGIFALSSTLYLLLDVLFLYVPLVNEASKCITLDNRMKIAALVLRSVGDSRYLIRIYVHIKGGSGKSPPIGNLLGIALCILPIPQVSVLVFLPKMKGSNSLKIMSFLNALVLSQYLPRAVPVYEMFMAINTENIGYLRSSRKLNLSSFFHIHPKWIFNIFGYLMASHVFGTFWYYFSIQREIDCWEYACKTENGCEFSTSCAQRTHTSITLLQKLCPTNPPDVQVFDFGVFHDALESGMQSSTNFTSKYLQCLSWAIRNLSSFGSNLDTSASGAENLLVVLFAICGLVLFMYLLGHMQALLQKVCKKEIIREKMKTINFQLILHEYGLSDENHEIERKIKLAVEDKLEEDENHAVDNMFSILSLDQARSFVDEIKSALFFDKLKKIDGLRHKDDLVLKKICKHLKPVVYNESSYMIREGEPLDMMFFLTQGIVLIYDSCGFSRTVHVEKEKNGLFGEELITWAETISAQQCNLPFSTRTIKSHTLVEIFAIKVTDLQRELSSDRHDVNNILTDIESSS